MLILSAFIASVFVHLSYFLKYRVLFNWTKKRQCVTINISFKLKKAKNRSHSRLFFIFFLAPPKLDKELKDQKITAGEQFKVKLPFSGTGPFEVKVKKDGKEIHESDRIKISPFDDYVTFVIKGIFIYSFCS